MKTETAPEAPRSTIDLLGGEMAEAIFSAASLLVVILDRDGRILRFNAACERATGFRAADVVGRSVWDLIPEDQRSNTEGVFRELRDAGLPNLHENDWKTSDGGCRRIAWSNTVLSDADGAVERVIGTGIDVTELRAAESRRRVSESRLAGIVESAMDAIVSVDASQRIVLFNPAAEQMFGRKSRDVIGRPLELLLPQRYRAAHREHVGRFASSGETSRQMGQLGLVRGVRADGTEFPVEASISHTPSESGILLTVILRDVTEAERTAAAERLLASLVRFSDDAILAIDPEGRILSWNPAAERIYGFARDEIEGESLLLLVPPEHHEELNALLKHVRDGCSVGHVETFGLRRGGGRFEVSLGLAPRRDASGAMIGASLVARDLSAYRGLERELKEAEELASVATLVTGIAHDIGTPMNVILGYTQMLARSMRTETDRERLRIVQEQVRRVVRLIQRLMNFARSQDEPTVALEVEALLDDALGLLSETARRRGIAIERDFAGTEAIRAKKERLERAFLNLFVNAADSMKSGGTLHVATRQLEDEVEIAIRDTGTGMDEETLERIFEPFFTTKAKGLGSGLGLLVTRGIISEHGGTIDVSSELGKGTELCIRLPRKWSNGSGSSA